jgi:hypothetical protein
MRLDLNKKPEGEWASFNEFCGTGDGETKDFKTPILASEARSVLVIRSTKRFEMLAPDNRLVVTNEKDGTILKDEPDGYKLETRDENDLWVVLDRPLPFGTRLSVSGLGRQVGDAFKVLPMSPAVRKRIYEKQPASLRKRDSKDVSEMDVVEASRISFQELVVDWNGITDGEDKPLPCDTETKKAFLDLKDATFFGLFVTNRAAAIRAEGMNSFNGDSSD